jgi:hypothetical protein
MDPDANLREQQQLAAALLEQLDHIPDAWAMTTSEAADVATMANRLAELVQALDDWIRSGGYLPNRWTGNRP